MHPLLARFSKSRVSFMPIRRPMLAVLCLVAAALSIGCKKEGDTATGGGSGEKVVNLYVFADYVPDDVLKSFTEETGIKVNVQTFENNEELQAKLQAGASEYDVISPSDYMVRRLAADGLIRKLDRAKLAGFTNLDPTFTGKSFDPQNDYSVPFFWGVTGIGYDARKTGRPIDSWKAVFDKKYSGNIVMLDDARELLTAALWTMDKSPNDKDPAVLEQAKAKVKEQKALVRAYDSNGFAELVAKGEATVAQGFNGQFAKVMAENAHIAFVVPKEGATIWIDNLAVPAKSKRPENAEALINYFLRPEVAKKLTEFSQYATPNLPARKLIDPKLLANETIYPTPETLKRCTTLDDLGESNKLIDGLMEELKG